MTKTIPALVALASVLGIALVSLGQQGQKTTTTTATTTLGQQEQKTEITATVTARDTTPEDLRWLSGPHEFKVGSPWWWGGGERGVFVSGYAVVDVDKVLRISLVRGGTGGDLDIPSYRLFVLDRDGVAYPLKEDSNWGVKNLDNEMKHALFSLDPKVLATDKIAKIAIERVTPPIFKPVPLPIRATRKNPGGS